jgi:hypothetical protein
LSAPDHDDVIADAEEALQDRVAEALAVAEQKHDRDQSPHDAEHGEAGTHAVAVEGVERLAEGFFEIHGGSE